MKIVILDGYTENPGDLSWDAIAAFGELTVHERTPADEAEIVRRIGDAEIAVTNKTPLSAAILAACPNLKFIAVLATGYNVVDIAAAKQRGIPVSNVPAYGTAAVGQFAIALLLEICCRVGHHDQAVKAGRWAQSPDFCFWDYPLIELDGKTLGIIGFGRIGRATGRLARALGMRVLATGSRECEEGRAIAEYVDLDRLLAESDVIALHCPLVPENEGIIRRENIEKMKPGVIIINTARGGLVNERDLTEALNSGRVRAAAVDVVSVEPIRPDNPLLSAQNCLITPHIAWASKECRERIMEKTVKNIEAFLAGAPINVVNG